MSKILILIITVLFIANGIITAQNDSIYSAKPIAAVPALPPDEILDLNTDNPDLFTLKVMEY